MLTCPSPRPLSSLYFPCLVGMPMWLMIFLLHVDLSISSPAIKSILSMSCWNAFFHLVFGPPISVFLLYQSSAVSSLCVPLVFLLITFPYHFSRLSVISLEACAGLLVPCMFSFPVLSLLPFHSASAHPL